MSDDLTGLLPQFCLLCHLCQSSVSVSYKSYFNCIGHFYWSSKVGFVNERSRFAWKCMNTTWGWGQKKTFHTLLINKNLYILLFWSGFGGRFYHCRLNECLLKVHAQPFVLFEGEYYWRKYGKTTNSKPEQLGDGVNLDAYYYFATLNLS